MKNFLAEMNLPKYIGQTHISQPEEIRREMQEKELDVV